MSGYLGGCYTTHRPQPEAVVGMNVLIQHQAHPTRGLGPAAKAEGILMQQQWDGSPREEQLASVHTRSVRVK